jgi:hypothetical protein
VIFQGFTHDFASIESLVCPLKIRALDLIQVYPLSCLPQIKMILHDHPAFRRAPQRIGQS